jgi:hypothetical protein
MPKTICYLGDGGMPGPACYLGGIMLHFGLPFDYVPSSEPPPADFAATPYALYVVSDYPAATFGTAAMEHVAKCVAQGAGLLMFGGWESYFGRLGEYHRSPLADVLPVAMQSSDDRRNYAQPVLMNKAAEHPILDGLPWDQPAGIGGFNAMAPKPGAQTLLTSIQFAVRRTASAVGFEFSRGKENPLLVVGRHGEGRTAALATDVAPHWVGGFVDWGDRRVQQPIAGDAIEVGNWYAQFFRNLLVWTGKLE